MSVLLVPYLRTSESARMHIERHHGTSHSGLRTLKQMVNAHAAMHGQRGGGKVNDIFADLKQRSTAAIPHIHDDGHEIRTWRKDNG